MEKIKTIPASKRPDDYFVSTCPVCGKQQRSRRTFGGQVNKTEYNCEDAKIDWSVTPHAIRGCNGLVKFTINPKYQ